MLEFPLEERRRRCCLREDGDGDDSSFLDSSLCRV
jgi:hypothetical protein